MSFKLENLPSDFLVAMAEYLDLPSQKALVESSKPLYAIRTELVRSQLAEAIKAPGIYQKAEKQAGRLSGDQKLAWITRQVDSLLEKAKSLLSSKELEEAGLNPDIQKLTPLEKVKLGELIAEKRASILVGFCVRLGPLIPGLNQFLQGCLSLNSRELANQIQDWLQAHPEIWESGAAVSALISAVPTLEVPVEILSFRNMLPATYFTLFTTSAYKGRSELLEALLRSPTFPLFPPDLLAKGLEDAASQRHLKVIKLLAESERFSEIPPTALGKALYQACIFNDLPIAQYLLNGSRANEIPLQSIEKACSVLDSSKHLPLLKLFMSRPQLNEISLDGLGRLLYAAVKSGHKEIVEKLRTHPKFDLIPARHCIDALEGSAIRGHVGIVNILMASSLFAKVPLCHLAAIFFKSVQENRLEVVKAFIASPRFNEIPLRRSAQSNENFEGALLLSDSWGYSEIAQALRNCPRFSELSQPS